MIINRAIVAVICFGAKISRSSGITSPAFEVRDVYIRYQLFAIPSAYKSDDIYHGTIVVDFISQETRDNFGG